MRYINLEDIMRDVLDKPETKVAFLDKNQDLWLEGEHKVKAEEYFVFTPIGAFAKIKGVTWKPEGQDHPVAVKLGFVSPDEVLFWEIYPRIKGHYHGNRRIAKSSHPFALFALFADCLEVYVATPDTDGVIHFLWLEDDRRGLFELCEDVIASCSSSASKEFRAFLRKVASLKEDIFAE